MCTFIRVNTLYFNRNMYKCYTNNKLEKFFALASYFVHYGLALSLSRSRSYTVGSLAWYENTIYLARHPQTPTPQSVGSILDQDGSFSEM